MTDSEEPVRWKFYDPALLSLFPATYLMHLAEEALAAAPIVHWGIRADRPLALSTFMAANAFGLVLMVIGIRLVRRSSAFHWIVPALAGAVLFNTLGHLVGSVAVREYSAGLITAVILWIPLGLLTLLRVWDQAGARTLRAGLLVAVAIELVVTATLPVIGSPDSLPGTPARRAPHLESKEHEHG